MNPIYIVSGLPRSGTSLMMQLLDNLGMPLLTDTIRGADLSNPKGYFEYEKVKLLSEDSSWLMESTGRAVKIISHLLFYLPDTYDYKIIFMKRDLGRLFRDMKIISRFILEKTIYILL